MSLKSLIPSHSLKIFVARALRVCPLVKGDHTSIFVRWFSFSSPLFWKTHGNDYFGLVLRQELAVSSPKASICDCLGFVGHWFFCMGSIKAAVADALKWACLFNDSLWTLPEIDSFHFLPTLKKIWGKKLALCMVAQYCNPSTVTAEARLGVWEQPRLLSDRVSLQGAHTTG